MIYGDYNNIAFEEEVLKEVVSIFKISQKDLISFFDESLMYPHKKIVHYKNDYAFIPKIINEETLFGDIESNCRLDVYQKKEWTNGKRKPISKIRIEFNCKMILFKYSIEEKKIQKTIPYINKLLWNKSYFYLPVSGFDKIPLNWKLTVTPDDIFLITKNIYSLYEINFKN